MPSEINKEQMLSTNSLVLEEAMNCPRCHHRDSMRPHRAAYRLDSTEGDKWLCNDCGAVTHGDNWANKEMGME